MSQELVKQEGKLQTLNAEERALITGDLNDLSEQQRADFYMSVCHSLGLNYLTRPFQYIEMWDKRLKRNKLMLYAGKDCTEQLRKINNVSLSRPLEKEFVKDLGIYTVTAYMRMPDGREDSAIGAVSVKGLSGDDLANAIMKAETKAKRRCTLGICGLAMLDESEVETVKHATPVYTEQRSLPKQEPTALDRAYAAIEQLFMERSMHPAHQAKSLAHHLGVEKLTDCTDIDKLRWYYAYENAKRRPWPKEQIETVEHILQFGNVEDLQNLVKLFNAQDWEGVKFLAEGIGPDDGDVYDPAGNDYQ